MHRENHAVAAHLIFSQRRHALLSLIGSALLMACQNTSAILGPRTLSMSEAQMLEKMAPKFPYHTKVMDLLQVEVNQPKLRFDEINNRIGTELPVKLTQELFGNKAYWGTLFLTYGLRYEHSDNTIRLSNVHVDNLLFQNLSSSLQGVTNRVASLLAERTLNDYTVYKVSDKDLHTAQGLGYTAGQIKVIKSGLSLELLPIVQK